jgi:hypothetical protein
MRRLSCIAALVGLLSVGALGTAGPATAKGPPGFFGLVPQGGVPSSADIERMEQGRVGTVRLVANWSLVEPTDDTWNFGALDEYVGDLAASGIRPFPVLFNTSPFVGPDELRLPVHSAQDKEEWKEFVAMVVERYGAGGEYWSTQYPIDHPGGQPMPVDALQVWNEQNGSKHAHDPNPSEYAELVKISNEAIDGVDTSVEVVLGGMFGSPRGEGGIPGAKFLKRFYGTAGVKEAFEAVAIHPYSPDVVGIKEQIEDVRKVLKKKKDKGADVWLTELGWGSSKKGRLGVGKKQQAKLLKQSFKLLLKKRGKWHVGGVLWYTWRDLPGGDSPCDWCSSAGLFKSNGTKPKPAWKQYVRFTGGS